MKERKELFCGTLPECSDFIGMQEKPEALEAVRNEHPGPPYSVFRRRKETDRTIKAPVRRLTRGEFRDRGRMRPLWVSLDPGDVITFCPKGTRQRIAVPIASLYQFARFTAARAIAAAKAAKRKAKKAAAC